MQDPCQDKKNVVSHPSMKGTVGGVLKECQEDADELGAVVVIRLYKDRSADVTWSDMPVTDLCLAQSMLTHEIGNVLAAIQSEE